MYNNGSINKKGEENKCIPKKNPILDLLVQGLPFRIYWQQVFEVRIVRQIRVYPVAEGELFLQSNRMRGPLAWRFRNPSQRFQILLFRDHLLKRGSQFVRLQLFAKFLELLERQSTLVLRPLFVVVLLDHLPHLVSGHLEAADVQGASQLRKIDETVPILVDLTKI